MDLLKYLKMMEANSNNNVVNSDVMEQHTNKSFLIDDHKSGMDYIETKMSDFNFQQTVTPDIKSSDVVPLNANNCIHLKDLLKCVNEPIVGKFLLCRTICPPYKMTALLTVVDDPDGKLTSKILLYNFLPNVSQLRSKDVYHYLPVGTILAIMNPWFKSTADGGFAVRCDNPSHVVMLDPSKVDEIFGRLTWNGQIPVEYQRNELVLGNTATALDWKKMGNKHFASKRFKEAVTAYTNGIESEDIKSKMCLDLLSNRSAAYLKLCNYKLALLDAQSSLDVDETHIKSIFRKANALFGMARYVDAVSFLSNELLQISNENRKIIDDLISKGKIFTAQSQTGDYTWKKIFENFSHDHNHELAEYQGPVVVKDSLNKGRGLFATETIKAGQLIMASKAFAYEAANSQTGIFMNSRNKRWLDSRSQTQLVTSIAQILNDCPEKCAEFYSLYGGVEYSKEAASSKDFQVDVKRIKEICHYNSFGQGGFATVAEDDISGIWISPSFINHSCVDGNSLWMLNGNFLFVRAFHDIPEGHEILINYIPPLEYMPQKKLEKYGFTCGCRLCERDRLDSPKMQAYRSDLQSKLVATLEENPKDKTGFNFQKESEVLNILKLLKKSRVDAHELNIFFLGEVSTFALIHYENGLFVECALTLEDVYKLTEAIAGLWDFTFTTITNIVASYLMIGDKRKAIPWYEILKQKTVLYYGSLDAIEARAPKFVAILLEFGLCSRQ